MSFQNIFTNELRDEVSAVIVQGYEKSLKKIVTTLGEHLFIHANMSKEELKNISNTDFFNTFMDKIVLNIYKDSFVVGYLMETKSFNKKMQKEWKTLLAMAQAEIIEGANTIKKDDPRVVQSFYAAFNAIGEMGISDGELFSYLDMKIFK